MSWWTWWQIPPSELGPAVEPLPVGLQGAPPAAPPFRIGVPAPVLSTTDELVDRIRPADGMAPVPGPARRERERDHELPAPEPAGPDPGGGTAPAGPPDFIRQVGNVLGDVLNRVIRTVGITAAGGAAPVVAGFIPQPFRPTPRPAPMPTPEPAALPPERAPLERGLSEETRRAEVERARREIIGGRTFEEREQARRDLADRMRERFAGETDITGPESL